MILKSLLQIWLVFYTPVILNTNIEQGYRSMPAQYTEKEQDFLEYFQAIDTESIQNILADYRSSGPPGYSTSLVLCRILKIKERISSDRELSEKLAKNPIYRQAVNITQEDIPAHNTFNTLRKRLGPEGFARIHGVLVQQAFEKGLLIPPLPKLPAQVKDKIIIIADSTFLASVASSKGEKDDNDIWIFTDESIAFGKPHHKHKYPVGHRAHTLMSVSGVPLVSMIAPANELDNLHLRPLLNVLVNRYPDLPFGCIILDTGYDAEDLHRDIYLTYEMLPIIIRKKKVNYGRGFNETGTPLCPFGYPTRRRGIEYNHQRTKYACYHACNDDPQKLLFDCPHLNSASRFGWMTRTRFKDGYRKHGPAMPGSRVYERLKPLRTGIERLYNIVKESRYRMEAANTYMGHDNVLIHVIEHDIVLTLDLLFKKDKIGKWSDVIKV